jgi:UDP-N-acetylmuramoylalanine--D-glutamate ligase
MQLEGKNVLVLGLGHTGLSMTRWLARRGARVRVADSRAAPPNAETIAREMPEVALAFGAFGEASFANVDVIAISPGVPVAEPLVQRARGRGVPVVGDIELFACAKSPAAKVIAITGSNGKSTVTTMVGAMCKAAGANVVVAGNIGLPVLDALSSVPPPQLFVLELSSFQLETTYSLDADAATVLNISEDHLDRYADMAAYKAAKARIFRGSGTQVVNRDDPATLAMTVPGRPAVTFGLDAPSASDDWGIRLQGGEEWLVRGDQMVMRVSELTVPGMHNAANALAALALCRALALPQAALVDGLRRFRGLPHRMELVATIAGVSFYNDSKGTNVGATVAALSGVRTQCVLIAGGDGKGQDFSPLLAPVRERARAVVLIGKDGERIGSALTRSGVPVVRAVTFEEAIRQAYLLALPGDAVLLSPACASYDMFRDYVHRGQEFARIVRTLPTASGSEH